VLVQNWDNGKDIAATGASFLRTVIPVTSITVILKLGMGSISRMTQSNFLIYVFIVQVIDVLTE
jgi:hypothetical protein